MTRMLSIRDVAARLGIAYDTAWKLVHAGEIAGVKLGRAQSSPIRIDPAELERYLAAHQLPVPAPSAKVTRLPIRSRSREEECARLGIDVEHDFS